MGPNTLHGQATNGVFVGVGVTVRLGVVVAVDGELSANRTFRSLIYVAPGSSMAAPKNKALASKITIPSVALLHVGSTPTKESGC